MIISIHIDFFETKCYNEKKGDKGDSKMNFLISEIVFTWHADKHTESISHKARPFHGFAMYTGGGAIYKFETGEELSVLKNDIIFLPEHSDYHVRNIAVSECYAINFRTFDDRTLSPFVVHMKNHAAVHECFKNADHAFTAKKAGYEMKCMSELYSIAYQVNKEREKEYFPNSLKAKISPALEYIHNNYTSPDLSVEELSELCGISAVYFRRIFEKCCGTSPLKYINNLRLMRAKELILSDMYSISRAAELSGFGDESYFCRFFKKSTGMSPSEFRKDFF